MEEALELHLGCGGRHLEGYRNIDFPPSEHTVQTEIRVDEYSDIRELSHGRSRFCSERLKPTKTVSAKPGSAHYLWAMRGAESTARRSIAPMREMESSVN